MKSYRFMIGFVALAVAVATAGTLGFCGNPAAGMMKCCQGADPCAAGIKAADCCSLRPMPAASPTPAAIAASTSSSVQIQIRGVSQSPDPGGIIPDLAVSWARMRPPAPGQRESTPLFLWNAALLI